MPSSNRQTCFILAPFSYNIVLQMRCLSQWEEHFGLFSQAGKEMDEDVKKQKEIKVKRGSVKESRILMTE